MKELYSPSAKKCSIVNVPSMNFFMIDGFGDPNTSTDFQTAIEALFSLSYTLKFMLKKTQGIDYGVMPLEGIWWCPNMEQFDIEYKENWLWTLMIMQPDFITNELYKEATNKVFREKKLVALEKLRFERYDEGLSTQILHIGPFSEERPTVDKLHLYISTNGYTLNGKHHEIYLSDIRRSDPKNWKTIIRQPIAK